MDGASPETKITTKCMTNETGKQIRKHQDNNKSLNNVSDSGTGSNL